MTSPQIIQPGQVQLQFEHVLQPGFQPAIPVNMRVGETMLAVGGLTVREEIASRILADIAYSMDDELPDCDMDSLVGKAIRLTDALLAKTRPQVQETPPQT